MLGAFGSLLAIWMLTALEINAAWTGPMRFLSDIRSQLVADYSREERGYPIGSLHLAMIEGALRDGRLSLLEARFLGTDLLSLLGFGSSLQGYGGSGGSASTATPVPSETPLPSLTPTPTDPPDASQTPPPVRTEKPAKEPKPTKTPKPTVKPPAQPLKAVHPILECVLDDGEGGYRAYFGYKNDNDHPVTVPIGTDNRFSPAPQARGQPTEFQPGRARNAFRVDSDGSNLVWTLQGHTSTATAYTKRCHQNEENLDPTPTPEPTEPPLGDAQPPPESVDDSVLLHGTDDPQSGSTTQDVQSDIPPTHDPTQDCTRVKCKPKPTSASGSEEGDSTARKGPPQKGKSDPDSADVERTHENAGKS